MILSTWSFRTAFSLHLIPLHDVMLTHPVNEPQSRSKSLPCQPCDESRASCSRAFPVFRPFRAFRVSWTRKRDSNSLPFPRGSFKSDRPFGSGVRDENRVQGLEFPIRHPAASARLITGVGLDRRILTRSTLRGGYPASLGSEYPYFSGFFKTSLIEMIRRNTSLSPGEA